MQVGTNLGNWNPKRTGPLQVRLRTACRGQRAWHAKKKTHGTGEALYPPAALTTRAKRVRGHNDKKCPLMGFRDSDRLIIPMRQGQRPEAGEGADTLTLSVEDTRTVRMTEKIWPTNLWTVKWGLT